MFLGPNPMQLQVHCCVSHMSVVALRRFCYILQVTFCLCSLLLTCLALTYVLTRAKPVYLRDFHVFKPPNECVLTDDHTLPCNRALCRACCSAVPHLTCIPVGTLICRLKISRDLFVELSKKSGVFSEKAMQFQERIMEKSGLGDETYLPPGEAHPCQLRNMRDLTKFVMSETGRQLCLLAAFCGH
jgi:3-ketoacyl-CoA synthase